jgi:hypothetical protein
MSHRWMIAPLLLAATLRLPGTDGDRTVIALHLNRNAPAWSGKTIDFGPPQDSLVIAEPGKTREGTVAGIVVRATRRSDPAGGYVLQLTGGQGETVSAVVTPAAPVRVEIRRPAGLLPYRISLDTNAGPNGSPRERMLWTADYRAEGTLSIGSCRALLAVWDMTLDGVFDRRDFRAGTAVGIDLNGDGKIGGNGEYLTGGEVFEFCGRRFFVDPDSLQPDGSAITVVETSIEKPKLGAPVPTLLMETTDGATLRSGEWKGKVVLLDFWAS